MGSFLKKRVFLAKSVKLCGPLFFGLLEHEPVSKMVFSRSVKVKVSYPVVFKLVYLTSFSKNLPPSSQFFRLERVSKKLVERQVFVVFSPPGNSKITSSIFKSFWPDCHIGWSNYVFYCNCSLALLGDFFLLKKGLIHKERSRGPCRVQRKFLWTLSLQTFRKVSGKKDNQSS